jgi:hypothetical protein
MPFAFTHPVFRKPAQPIKLIPSYYMLYNFAACTLKIIKDPTSASSCKPFGTPDGSLEAACIYSEFYNNLNSLINRKVKYVSG